MYRRCAIVGPESPPGRSFPVAVPFLKGKSAGNT